MILRETRPLAPSFGKHSNPTIFFYDDNSHWANLLQLICKYSNVISVTALLIIWSENVETLRMIIFLEIRRWRLTLDREILQIVQQTLCIALLLNINLLLKSLYQSSLPSNLVFLWLSGGFSFHLFHALVK